MPQAFANCVPEDLRRPHRGTAALEFALFAPMLLILLVGVIELGDGVFESMQVQDAAEAGAVYVSKHGWNAAGVSAAVVNATGLSGITASPAPSTFCGCSTAAGITAKTCATTCTDGTTAANYVKINSTLAHESILTLPWLVMPTTLTGQAIVRVN
jgi:Flp pilus assembly protein TadG